MPSNHRANFAPFLQLKGKHHGCRAALPPPPPWPPSSSSASSSFRFADSSLFPSPSATLYGTGPRAGLGLVGPRARLGREPDPFWVVGPRTGLGREPDPCWVVGPRSPLPLQQATRPDLSVRSVGAPLSRPFMRLGKTPRGIQLVVRRGGPAAVFGNARRRRGRSGGGFRRYLTNKIQIFQKISKKIRKKMYKIKLVPTLMMAASIGRKNKNLDRIGEDCSGEGGGEKWRKEKGRKHLYWAWTLYDGKNRHIKPQKPLYQSHVSSGYRNNLNFALTHLIQR